MTKKEYIDKLESLIINKIKYHSPRVTGEIDYSLLDAVGIDGSYPIFVFSKPLNKVYFKAFYKASKNVDFNLILTERPFLSNRKMQKIKRKFLMYKDDVGSELLELLEQLNINYITHSDFKKKLNYEYLKIDDEEIKFDYLPYFLSKKIMKKGVVCDIKSYILNGKNYSLSFNNTNNKKQSISFEFNLPLPRGYYKYKKGSNFIEIENLTNQIKAYFNFNFRNADFSFSTVSGVESCTFACINVLCKIELLPKELKKLYFNFGENKYCLFTPFQINSFFELSQAKMNETFDIQITSRDGKQDNFFNYELPRKIWESWYNFELDEESENSYVKMINKIIKKEDSSIKILNNINGLKEVKFFRNNRWKRVFIVHNNSNYLFADKVKYFNFSLITKEIFDKNNEVYLSVAE